MNCPNEDKLLGFVDRFLDEKETKEIEEHIRTCPTCAGKIEEMENEISFLKETLKSPELPDDFGEKVVAQVTPYKPKEKRRWRWGMGTAAWLLLAGGILMMVNPGFAEFVGGIFSNDPVDESLQMAMNEDIVTPVDISVTDDGITLHVEQVVADRSRIELFYSVTDSNGKKLDPLLDLKEKSITLLDDNDVQVETKNSSWGKTENFGKVEIFLINDENFKKGTVQLDIREIDGKKGNWLVNIPVDLTEAFEKQQIVELDEKIEVGDVVVKLNQVTYDKSKADISYMTDYTDKTKQKLKSAIKKKEQQFNKDFANVPFRYFPLIGYRIENEQGEVLGYSRGYGREIRDLSIDKIIFGGTVMQDYDQIVELEPLLRNDSFEPKQGEEKLYFVLAKVNKINAADFSITFRPDELPYTFEYKGYELTIDAVEKKIDYSYDESGVPVDQREKLELSMSGFSEQKVPEFSLWMLEDGSGKSYFTYVNGRSRLDLEDTDDRGRFKREIQLDTYGLDDIPEEITLHLLMELETIELENEWRVPLFEK